MKSTQTRAGLMVRSSLAPNAAHVSLLNGLITEGRRCSIVTRLTNSFLSQELASLIVQDVFYPAAESWLRIKREGNRITCYRSGDNSHWAWLESTECALGDTPYLGLVLVAGSDATDAASASFRQYEVVTNAAPTIAIFSQDLLAREAGLQDAMVAVHCSGNGPLTVQLSFAGAATNGIDYLAPPEVLIPANTNTGFLKLSALNDTRPSPPRDIQVVLRPQVGVELVDPTNATVLLLDDDQTRGGLIRQMYPQLGGASVSELKRQLTDSTSLTFAGYVSAFETERSTNGRSAGVFSPVDPSTLLFGEVVAGYLVPPLTGNYLFYLASDDTSELWLSTDESAAHLRRVAAVAGFTPFRFYSGSGNHSAAIPLEQGKYYYVRAFHKQRMEESCFSVAWQLPGGSPPTNGAAPIGGEFLAFSLPAVPAIQLLGPEFYPMELTCQTAGARFCVLESSDNLQTWIPFWTNSFPARLQLELIDPPSDNSPARFYRALVK